MGFLRIGELARRTSLSPEVLRAWERRYGIPRPSRSEGGYRLYGEDDVRRIARMQELIADGLAAAEAARLALADGAPSPDAPEELAAALGAFDDARAHAAFDRLLAELSVEAVLVDAVLPLLRDLGERWQVDDAGIAEEHFASQFLRGRLLGLARGWDRGIGPRALLACAPGELHDLPLIVFGLALRGHGWRVTLLGADTPVATLADAARTLAPAAVVVSSTRPGPVAAAAAELAAVPRPFPLWLAGAGVTEAVAGEAGAQLLGEHLLEGAARLALRGG